jgi:hypothetical protein
MKEKKKEQVTQICMVHGQGIGGRGKEGRVKEAGGRKAR